MKKYIVFFFTACCLLLCSSGLFASERFGYSEEHPLVIVSDWDFSPFEYISSEGRPTGYNIEVLDLILTRLEIPHKFVMQEWHVATKMFEKREADLIHALSVHYNHKPYFRTKKYVNYYTLRAVRRMDTPPLFRLRDLGKNSTMLLKKDDYASLRIQEKGDVPFEIVYRSPKDALTAVRNGEYNYFIWGEIPLRFKMTELSIDSLVLDPIDIPAGELRIIGYNKALIDMIDDQFTRLEQAGELRNIYDKWFHPEREHDNASPVTLFLLAGLVVVGVLVFFLGRLAYYRLRKAVQRSNDLNNMMAQALNMGDYYVMEYDISSGHVRNVHGNLLPEGGMDIDEFYSRILSTEREGFMAEVEKMKQGESTHWTLRKCYNAGTASAPSWRYLYGQAILELEHGRPRYIVNTVKDITREVEDERHNQELASRYMKIFDTGLMAMSFYDGEGHLLDLNQKMRELCHFDVEGERYFRETNLFDDPHLEGFYQAGSLEPLHVCQHLNYPKLGVSSYIETRITPVTDEGGKLVYYVITSRDVSGEREMYMQQRAHDRQLQDTNAIIRRYEQRFHYLLQECDMYVWQLDIASREINFSRTLGKVEFSVSYEQYVEGMNAEEREQADRNLEAMIEKGAPFHTVHHFNYIPSSPEPCWYLLHGLPVRDAQGVITGYFGLARDITHLMEAQERLRQETERAENSGRLKSAFLANMTHEIRTPLNAIVGFSGLLQMIDVPEERKEFIRIIRNNCDMLLRLINDILEASSMGQSMAIEPEPLDLAVVFDDICQTLEQRVQESGVPFIKDNPYDTFPAVLDKGRLQQILTNFVTNAVKYTHEGHIRVGYRSETRNGEEGLYFYCEDTGAGIPKEKQDAVFERFVKLNDYVQGTGLGLSICKSIVERCDGDIGVYSEGEGHGSTFWFWVPLKS